MEVAVGVDAWLGDPRHRRDLWRTPRRQPPSFPQAHTSTSHLLSPNGGESPACLSFALYPLERALDVVYKSRS